MLNNIINNFNTQLLTPSSSIDWSKISENIAKLPQATTKKSTNSFSKFMGKAGDELKWLGQDVGDLAKTAGLTSTGGIAGIGEIAYGVTDSLIKQPDMMGVEDKVVSGLSKGAWKVAGLAPNPYTIGAAAALSGFDLLNKGLGKNLNSDGTQDMVNTGYANFSADDLLKEGGKGKKGTLWSRLFHKGRTRDQNARIDSGKKANLLASNASYLNEQNTLASQNTTGVLHDKYWQQKMGGVDTRMLAAKKGGKIHRTEFEHIIRKAKSNIKLHKSGGKLEDPNIIPDGAFHSRKNNLPDEIAKDVTHKGIPVIVKDGDKITQIAEIERSEIVFNKTVSEKIEDYLKDYNEAETQKEKDKIAIECGKLISDQIINNTIDNVGLLNKE